MITKVKADLLILRNLNMKPNYSELSRKYGITRQTIAKYDKGFEKKETRNRASALDEHYQEISEKINLPGATITGVYKYFYNKNNKIGCRSNFDYYVRKHKLITKTQTEVHPRFETPYGKQLQFDFKEKMKMISKHGEIFEFNVFTTTLGASRAHKFTYSKTKTKEDILRCLIESFKYYGGVTEELLTDHMSGIVNTVTKKFNEEYLQFAKDFGFKSKKCRVRMPQTKGKVESANRFLNRLVPYNHEFEDEESLIKLIDNLTDEVNNEINQSTKVKPIMLLKKEKEYLSPLPCQEIIESYLDYMSPAKVHKDSMIYYKGKRYSVPNKFINKTLKVKEYENKLYIYNSTDLIRIHEITQKLINYNLDDYRNILSEKMPYKESDEIEVFTIRNLAMLDNLRG
jgi:transposase